MSLPHPFAAIALAAALAARPAAAEDGLELGVRAGYASPTGNVARGGPGLDATLVAAAPLWLDLGWRATPWVFLGGLLQYAPVFPRSCGAGDCGGVDARVGVEAILHVLPDEAFDPWIGISTAYEQLSTRVGTVRGVLRGVEWVDVQLGADWRPRLGLALGPFLALGIGEYYVRSTDETGTFRSASIATRDLHEWWHAGVKLTWLPR